MLTMPRSVDSAKERQWLERFRRWHQSGTTIRAFCERHGLSEPSFYQWRRSLHLCGLIHADGSVVPSPEPAPAFLQVNVERAVASTANAIELVLPRGRLLRIPSHFDPDALRQLLAVLEEPAC